MADINAPVEPDVIDPGPAPKLAGDWKDDDGEAIDEMFEAPSHQPLDYDVLIRDDLPDEMTQPTRLIVRAFTVLNDVEPIQVLPPDPNRLQLQLKFDATVGSARLHVASEKADLYGVKGLPVESPAGTLLSRSFWVTLDAHTGALWVWPDPSDGGAGVTFNINVIAVTR